MCLEDVRQFRETMQNEDHPTAGRQNMIPLELSKSMNLFSPRVGLFSGQTVTYFNVSRPKNDMTREERNDESFGITCTSAEIIA